MVSISIHKERSEVKAFVELQKFGYKAPPHVTLRERTKKGIGPQESLYRLLFFRRFSETFGGKQ